MCIVDFAAPGARQGQGRAGPGGRGSRVGAEGRCDEGRARLLALHQFCRLSISDKDSTISAGGEPSSLEARG